MSAAEEAIPEAISHITEMHADFFYNGDVGIAQSGLEVEFMAAAGGRARALGEHQRAGCVQGTLYGPLPFPGGFCP